MFDITRDIQSLTTFRRPSGEFMKQLKRTKRPVLLRVNGKTAAVVQYAEAYQRLLDIVARADADKVSVRVWTTSHTRVAARQERCLTRFAADCHYRLEFAARTAGS